MDEPMTINVNHNGPHETRLARALIAACEGDHELRVIAFNHVFHDAVIGKTRDEIVDLFAGTAATVANVANLLAHALAGEPHVVESGERKIDDGPQRALEAIYRIIDGDEPPST